jgi:MFS family permease
MTSKTATLSLLLLSLFLFFLLPPLDPDLGWHLRCGEEIWQGNFFCHQNEFSLLLANYEWPNHFWLYEAIIYPVFKIGGLWGLSIFGALVASGAFLFLFSSLKKPGWVGLALLPVVIYFSWGVFSLGVRGQIAGFFFFCLLLYLLTKEFPIHLRGGLCGLLGGGLLMIVMLVWANAHGSAILGLILLTVFGWREFQQNRYKFDKRLWIFPVAGLTTLFNPYGWRIYEDAWRHFTGVNLNLMIAEWVPPPLIFQTAISIIVLALLGVIFYHYPKGVIWQGIALIFLAVAALKARRQVPHFMAISTWVFFESLGEKLTRLAKEKEEQITQVLSVVFVCGSLFVNIPGTIETNSDRNNYCNNQVTPYPCKAIEYLKSQPAGNRNLFNRYEWGGFLIWQLPEYKIFVDGRMPAWKTPSGKSPYTIYLETLQTRPGWAETLAEYDIDWILISPGTFMDILLAPEPEMYRWEEKYRDEVSVVYNKISQ